MSGLQKIRRLVGRGVSARFVRTVASWIDLGKWFGGEHVISEPLRPEHFEKFAGLPPGEHLD